MNLFPFDRLGDREQARSHDFFVVISSTIEASERDSPWIESHYAFIEAKPEGTSRLVNEIYRCRKFARKSLPPFRP